MGSEIRCCPRFWGRHDRTGATPAFWSAIEGLWRCEFAKKPELTNSISSMGSGVCAHSRSSSTSKETYCMVDQPNPGGIKPSFSIPGPVEGFKNATRFENVILCPSRNLQRSLGYNKKNSERPRAEERSLASMVAYIACGHAQRVARAPTYRRHFDQICVHVL